MQALRAPHGRGPGWGEIGRLENRMQVTDLLRNPSAYQAEIASALEAMADSRSAFAVLAVPDVPGFGENHQDALLNSMRKLRPRRSLLVWRPVLAILAALDLKLPESAQLVGVVGHTGDGFTAQKMKMRHGPTRAPERREAGREYVSALGLGDMLADAQKELRARSQSPKRADHLNSSPNAWKLALGHPCEVEPVRRENGQWELITPPPPRSIELDKLPEALRGDLESCDWVILETPLKGSRRETLREGLADLIGRPVLAVGPEDIALGGLEAARRLADTLPVYFDFLPQISTIVQHSNKAINYDLVPRDALLPAGTIYRSEMPARLGLHAGSTEIKVYLLKEGNPRPRLAVVSVSTPPLGQVSVELHVEQAPASGGAKLTLESKAFSSPLVVNWEKAEEIDMPWDELIESLEPELPTVPNRLVLPCGMDNWEDLVNRPGLLSLLNVEVNALLPNWGRLANKISNRPFGYYAVSSDGDVPVDLPKDAAELFEKVISSAEADVQLRLAKTGGSTDNHSLRFLTWLFRKCPGWLVLSMIEALDAPIGQHVFVQTHQSRTLMLQGLGRIAREREDQRRIFDHLLGVPFNKWNKNQMACAAFLLSRTDSAPKLLKREEVEFIGDLVIKKLHDALGQNFTTRYSYGPYLLVGLLRWRLVDPRALVAGQDLLADRLLQSTQNLVADLATHLKDQPHLARYHAVLVQVCEEISGHGSNPDILIDLENLTR
jgi:hypothetical protein